MLSDSPPARSRPNLLVVVGAVIVADGRLLVVSKKAAPEVFYLPGGKPEPGESLRQALIRELGEELCVQPESIEPLTTMDDMAALEGVPMRMTVYGVMLSQQPRLAAELAAMGWTDGNDQYGPLLAPAIGGQLMRFLRSTGRLPRSG
ncbi:MAG TPA: NUDIX domain-containing protein [Streptosporangiaceae bacterium]|nr:NUDIX domain-containing protein [Streptosporangiaceae bacterium]